MGNWNFIDDDLRKSIEIFCLDLRKDFYFFSFCGFFAGVVLIFSIFIQHVGLCENIKWSQGLLEDFISVYAFMLVFAIYIFMGLMLAYSKKEHPVLTEVVIHIGERLRQTGSSIISFLAGFILFTPVYWLITRDHSVVNLIFVLFLFITFIATAVLTAPIIVQRKAICDKTMGFTIVILLSIYFLIIKIGP